MVTSYLFLRGPIALHGLVQFLNTAGPSVTKVVYDYFDRISCIDLLATHKSNLAMKKSKIIFKWGDGSMLLSNILEI